MSLCLNTISNFEEECPNLFASDAYYNPFALQKTARYLSSMLNKAKSLFVHQWFHGRPFTVRSSSPSFMARGLIRNSALIRNEMINGNELSPHMRHVGCETPPLRVVLKCFHLPDLDELDEDIGEYDEDYSENQALIYEQRMYSCVIANFESVPFFVYPLAIIEKNYESGDRLKQAPYSIDKAIMDHWDTETGTFHVTVCEDCGGLTLHNYLDSTDTTDRDTWAVVVQTLSALKKMQDFQVVHNDLHFGNILVKTDMEYWFDVKERKVISNEEQEDYYTRTVVNNPFTSYKDYDYYQTRGLLFGTPQDKVKMTNMIKIFDWDRSCSGRVTRDLGDNPMTEDIDVHLTTYNESYDTVSFLKQLVLYVDRSFFPPSLRADIYRLEYNYPWVFDPWVDGKKSFDHLTCYTDSCESKWPDAVHDLVRIIAKGMHEFGVKQLKL
jgi:hypothetical protein